MIFERGCCPEKLINETNKINEGQKLTKVSIKKRRFSALAENQCVNLIGTILM